jgi:chromosome partitioning protein
MKAAQTMKHTPRVIVLASSKGGVGKSTLASALAVQAAKDGAEVALIDWEPQSSMTLWWVLRGKPHNPQLIQNGSPADAVETVKHGDWDWAFVDTSPSGMDQIEDALKLADFVLVPVQASLFDLAAVHSVAIACLTLRKPFAFVLNAENPRREGLNSSAVVHLKKMGTVLAERVQDRTVYVSALTKGLTGPEHPDQRQSKEARTEIAALWAAVQKLAGKARAR